VTQPKWPPANPGRFTTRIFVSIVPGQQKSGDATSPSPPTITVNVSPRPLSRAYIYLSKNPFFSDSANIGSNADGMLTSSDSSSNQQFTAILTELAQTAPALHPFIFNPAAPSPAAEDDLTICKSVINKRQYYRVFDNIESSYTIVHAVYNGVRKGVPVNIKLHLDIPPVASGERATVGEGHWGLVAFFPVPSTVTLNCVVGSGTPIALIQPTVVYLYTDSHFVDPKRDFLTNPQDTYTFCNGFICGHKYVAQSPAKTIVDTATAPVRALMPSVTITTNTAVQTGGGKPDQTTTTTNTQVGPPKGP
jgi:hypothetical protein